MLLCDAAVRLCICALPAPALFTCFAPLLRTGQDLLIWGQPAAWADQVIQTWVSDYVQSLYPHVLQIVDCMGAQWAPDVLSHVWANQQLQMPIAPGATSFLQVSDTHIHAHLKQYILQANARLQDQFDQHAMKAGELRLATWGPRQIVQVLAEAVQRLRQQHAARDIPLTGAIQNQLLMFRPGANGRLQCYADDGPEWSQAHPLRPPGRGISLWSASQRLVLAEGWPEGVPPEPDWAQLDLLGNYLEQLGMPAEPGPDDIVIEDFPIADLELTEEQRLMLRPPEARLQELLHQNMWVIALSCELLAGARRPSGSPGGARN